MGARAPDERKEQEMIKKVDVGSLPGIVAVDFDGVLVEDRFPHVGEPRTRVIARVHRYKELGYRVILWTCRHGEALEYAVNWCKEQGIEFDAINENIPEVKEMFGTDTRKVYADFYIDDKSVPV